jgi:hypothetical protein
MVGATKDVRQRAKKAMYVSSRTLKSGLATARFDVNGMSRYLMKEGRPQPIAEVIHFVPRK